MVGRRGGRHSTYSFEGSGRLRHQHISMFGSVVRLHTHSCHFRRGRGHTPKESILQGHEVVVRGTPLGPDELLRRQVGKQQVRDDVGQGEASSLHSHHWGLECLLYTGTDVT